MSIDRAQYLEAFFARAHHGLAIVDAAGKVILSNEATAQILGRPIEDIAEVPDSNPDLAAVDLEGKPLSVDQYPPMIAVRSGTDVENVIMGVFNPRIQQRRWVSVDAGPIYDGETHKPIAAYCIFIDVTERIKAEKELRQSKMHLMLAQTVASIGSAAVDFRTGDWDWSDETFRIYGVDRSTFKPSAETLATLVHPDDWPLLYSHYLGAQKGETPAPIEYRIRKPNGEERQLRRIATLVRDKDGLLTGIVGTVQDVTDLRAVQKAKQELEAQLYHAQKLEALGVLASGIAHDLNNTLVPVVALSQTILEGLPQEDSNRPLLDLIKLGGERARDLVRQVLAFSRREALEHITIQVKPFLQKSLKLLRAGIPANIEIVEDIRFDACINGNQGQLHQIILNLFSNAAQAIGHASGKIRLTTQLVKQEGGIAPRYISIGVEDSGCGMNEEIKMRIFEPFFTTKRVGSGSGLGLSVVHGITAAHGGRVIVTSEPGKGSRFDILLPIAA